MKYLICTLIVLVSLNSFSQNVITLYPEGVPGLKSGVDAKEADVSEQDDGVSRLRHITSPTLTVFKANKKYDRGASVIICPGGGYYILAFNKEGTSFGEWFAARGITAFVLKYRLPQEELFTDKSIRPLQDAQQAFRHVRENAAKYGLDINKVGVMGFSAGGHLAATASTHFDTQVGEIVNQDISVRPDFSILAYPVISFNDRFGHMGSRKNLIGPELHLDQIDLYSNELHITANTPPAFLVHANDDGVSAENSLAYVNALRKAKVPVELHLYEHGGHGFGLAKNSAGPVKNWTNNLEQWLKDREYIK